MCAYNSRERRSLPAATTTLLSSILRGEWGFKGYVVSDCGAVTNVSQGHSYAKSVAEGFAVALKAGTDLDCVAPSHPVVADRDALLQAVHDGLILEADLDRALHRLFAARFQLGMFDPPAIVPYSKIRPAENDTLAYRQLALKAARESIVLLKNQDGFLPLKKKYGTIAVIGPNADSLDALVGNYNGTPSHPVTVLAGIRERFRSRRWFTLKALAWSGQRTRPFHDHALHGPVSCEPG